MGIICKICGEELPKKAFYPSILKKGTPYCKKCCYEKWQKKANAKYVESLKNLPDPEFNRLYGGYNIKILNFAREGEFRFTISSTDGNIFKTNDPHEFMEKLCQELRLET